MVTQADLVERSLFLADHSMLESGASTWLGLWPGHTGCEIKNKYFVKPRQFLHNQCFQFQDRCDWRSKTKVFLDENVLQQNICLDSPQQLFWLCKLFVLDFTTNVTGPLFYRPRYRSLDIYVAILVLISECLVPNYTRLTLIWGFIYSTICTIF